MTVISGHAELLRGFAGDPKMLLHSEAIEESARHGVNLTRQLLAFSRRQVLEPETLDLNKVVTKIQKMLRRVIGEHIQLRTSLEPVLWPVECDSNQIEQVLLNLALNGRDAMPEGGRLTIKTMNIAPNTTEAGTEIALEREEHVVLSVCDDGCGMDRQTRKRLFEPFFTTKEDGTGLGLSTVYGIVKQSGGCIRVESDPGKGTSFHIHLPRQDGKSNEIGRERELSSAPGGSETILVAEDEDDIRDLLGEFLGSNGYILLSARGGEEALSIAKEHEGPIHLLLTDVVMPGMDGDELARRLLLSRPETKLLFV